MALRTEPTQNKLYISTVNIILIIYSDLKSKLHTIALKLKKKYEKSKMKHKQINNSIIYIKQEFQ